MADEKDTRPAADQDDPVDDDDDVEGHVMLRSAAVDTPPAEDDVEGHAFHRGPASRGE